jgi:hypothetical protein
MADSYRIGPYGSEFMVSQKAGMDSDVTDKLPAGDYELRANSVTLRCRRNRRRFLSTRGDGGHPRTSHKRGSKNATIPCSTINTYTK